VGMNDHVSKPIDPALLFTTMSRFYKSRPTPSPSPSDSEQVSESLVPTPDDDLPRIEGLDTRDGLGRVAGNRKLYLKLLRRFVEQQGTAAAQIANALERNEVSAAERLAHTVKGVSGNLGIRTVQEVAAQLEKEIATQRTSAELAPVLREFKATLEGFVSRLHAALPREETVSVLVTPLDAQQAGQVIAEMIGHLNNFDPAAGDCLETNRTVFRALLPGESFITFKQQVDGFAFADALAGLEQVAKEKGLLSA